VRQLDARAAADRRRQGAVLTRRALLALVCALGFSPVARADDAVTVHDAFGRLVTLPAPPQRIVPVFASNTEIVASLGLAARIVGIDGYTRYPAEVLDRPRVGGRLGFSVDEIAALRPDLVIVTPSRQAANQLVDPMERLGIPVIVLSTRSIDEVLANIRLIGRVAGVPRRGEDVATRFEVRLARVAERAANGAAPRVVMITGRLGNGLMLVARDGTYTGDAILRAGGRFGLVGSRLLAQVSPEAILNADPDVLLWAGSREDLQGLLARPGWADLRAVRTGRAHTVSRAELLIPGPRTIDGIEHLAAIFHPAAGR
jgi:iron complex transport system substrate-binding protein